MLDQPVAGVKAGRKASPTPPATPTVLSTSAYQLFDEIRHIYQELSGLDNLSPGPKINNLLTRLVRLCIQPYGSDLESYFLGIDGVPELCASLQSKCAIAEGELEKYWAQRILSTSVADGEFPLTTPACNSRTRLIIFFRVDSEPRDTLRQFPYFSNYVDLSRLETSLLSAFLPPVTTTTSPLQVAFIGSGPMPLTSFCLADTLPNAKIQNIDRDASALALSEALSDKTGYGTKVSFTNEDVSLDDDDFVEQGSTRKTQWKEMDVVFLAALVGIDTEAKLSILESLARKMRPGALVVARSARGLRTVLYPVSCISRIYQETLLILSRFPNYLKNYRESVTKFLRKCIRILTS